MFIIDTFFLIELRDDKGNNGSSDKKEKTMAYMAWMLKNI